MNRFRAGREAALQGRDAPEVDREPDLRDRDAIGCRHLRRRDREPLRLFEPSRIGEREHLVDHVRAGVRDRELLAEA